MLYSDNALNILVALTYKGVGRAWIAQNIRGGETIEAIVSLLQAKGCSEASALDFEQRRIEITDKVLALAPYADGVVAWGDDNFPPNRGMKPPSLGKQPVVLFYKGDLGLLSRAASPIVTVIGLLTPDRDIELAERLVVSRLVEQGVTILSGLALGCDSIAHHEALERGGKTIAILPSTLQQIVPKSNQGLAERIVAEGGLLLTEYYEEVRARTEQTTRYIDRDRLQALYSDCVLLAASYSGRDVGKDSGARHAMSYALEISVARAVIYSEAKHKDNPMYNLNREILSAGNGVVQITSNTLDEAIQSILSKAGGQPRLFD